MTSAPTDPTAPATEETTSPLDADVLQAAIDDAHREGDETTEAAVRLALGIYHHEQFRDLLAHASLIALGVPQGLARTDKAALIGLDSPETERGAATRIAGRIVDDLGVLDEDRDEAVWMALVLAADCTRARIARRGTHRAT